MRRVETVFTCDRCSQTASFSGVRDPLPSHWAVLSMTDGAAYSYRKCLVCLPCRRDLDEFFNVRGTS